MSDVWTKRWDERYSKEEFAYGEIPNQFLEAQLPKLDRGSILFPAEGEGRNAVYAAKLGWKVSAFDISSEGQKKAFQLAKREEVSIDYQVGTIESFNYTKEQFDAIALIYAHFPANIKSEYHQKLGALLKQGGYIIFEAFSKRHLEYLAKDEKMGGPKEIDMLFSIEEIQSDFPNYHISILEEKEVELKEGAFHDGTGSVIRFVGQKK
ncbi:class I SAM-dependent methyltransferase [Leptospira brenneri]|uniref:Class I SAM-dependent methyltransferase n=1 Tax=Leptospira brenneri TaxID=2023182 RepID=A0A2M9XWQ0_9LEPT|nr:class I SAM-dependent methyltransferase [Leptospira brenneri]PJZ43750.1 SAM-dependent methyltransferase [Leptospira brenneri]TGK94052.1 class I SAM-dependent methyltransferase [Leptospira brenneri]